MKRLRGALSVVALALAIGGNAAAEGPASIAAARVSSSFLSTVTPRSGPVAPKGQAENRLRGASLRNSGVPGIDSLTNFTDQFTAPGFDSDGNPQSVWPYSMVGRAPERGGPTFIGAPIIPVVLDLLGPDGQIATFNGHPLSFDGRNFVRPVVKSPMFQFFNYFTGFTQFNDAMMRPSSSTASGEAMTTTMATTYS